MVFEGGRTKQSERAGEGGKKLDAAIHWRLEVLGVFDIPAAYQ